MSAAYAWRKPALLILMAVMLRGASTVVVQSNDPPGVGTNDTTPTSPVGGNSGATLGEQRLIALQWAANKWGATLDSFPRVTIPVTWEALSCTDVKAALGAAGPQSAWHDFAGATVSNTWYAAALANALFGGDLDPNTTEISAVFNVNLGNTGCLSGVPFYLGLDNNAGNNVDLVSVALHEFAHGLGFLTLTDGATGRQRSDTAPHPSIWDNFLLDTTTGLLWKDMTNAQRAASAINTRRLVWNGTNVTNAVPQVLAPGTPVLKVTAPMSIAGTYSFGTAEFGPPLASPGVSAGLAQVVDTTGGANFGCNAFSPTNAAALSGKIALLDRGTCNFTVKVKNAQNAGALGVVIADNVAESLLNMSGFDPTIFIPSVIITQADGATLKSALAAGAVNATLGVDMNLRQGADPSGRALMYTPNPYQPGSSVSHWDLIAFPDQLMEPATSPDVSHEVTPPHDLTASLFHDIGWVLATIPTTPAPPQ